MKDIDEIQKHVFEGDYYWITGPTYESKIECEFLMRFGMDLVGMSTVPEFLAASAIGIKTLGVAMVTDVLDRTGDITHLEVMKQANRAVPVMTVLLLEIIKKIKIDREKSPIRACIDSHINYPGDMSKIEEIPLVQPRELLLHKEAQMEEVVAGMRKAMKQLEIEKFDFGCLLLNTAKHQQIACYHESYFQIPMKNLPHAPVYSASMKRGVFVIGKLAESGAACLTICNLEIEGLKNFESHFIVRIIKKLGINLVYSVVASEWMFGGETAVLPIAGYLYRGFSNSVNPSSRLGTGLVERRKIGEVIRKVKSSTLSNPTLFGFEGTIKPMRTELLMTAYFKFDAYSLGSL